MQKPKIIKEIQKKVLVRRRIKTRSELEEEIAHAETLNLKEVLKKRGEEEIEKEEKEKKEKTLEEQVREAPVEAPAEKKKEKPEELAPVLAYKINQEQKQEYRVSGQQSQQQEAQQMRQATYTTPQQESENIPTRREYERPHERETRRDKPIRYRTSREED